MNILAARLGSSRSPSNKPVTGPISTPPRMSLRGAPVSVEPNALLWRVPTAGLEGSSEPPLSPGLLLGVGGMAIDTSEGAWLAARALVVLLVDMIGGGLMWDNRAREGDPKIGRSIFSAS